MSDNEIATHVVIPDTQVKPGVPLNHLDWIGRYIVDHFAGRPNVTVVHLGDHWDMPSLSSYDKGKKSMEGRRVQADIEAGNKGIALIKNPTDEHNGKRRIFKERQWNPRWVLLRGNHEDRVSRAIEDDAQLDGFLSLDLLKSPGWEVIDFLRPIEIDGISYAHYFYNPMTGKALGGMVLTRLKNLGFSFTMGHQQTLDWATRTVKDKAQHALVAGACYLHDEEYKGYQGNAHWRGIVVCHEVHDGQYDPMFISLDYLCRRYEGMSLADFMTRGKFILA